MARIREHQASERPGFGKRSWGPAMTTTPGETVGEVEDLGFWVQACSEFAV